MITPSSYFVISIRLLIKVTLLCSAALLSGTATAQHVVEGSDLKEVEWQAWPEWCKAGFLASEWSRTSPFRGQMSPERIKSVREGYYSAYGISGPHHLCLAMVYLNRIRAMPAGGHQFTPRNNLIKKTINELHYCYSRTEKSAGGMSLLNAYRGTAFHLDGQRQKAIEAWQEGIDLQPGKKESYLAWAQALISEKKLDQALKVLTTYDAVKELESPDGEYFLGYIHFETGRLDEAERHLNRAKELGYPSQTLLRKLEKLRASK